jgi:hypothetical protein
MTTATARSELYQKAFLAYATGGDAWKDEIDPEALQALAVLWTAEDRDTPAKQWSQGIARHPAIYRFLRIDPAESVAAYAVEPFRVWQDPDTGKNRILAAWPCPRLIDEQDDHLDIEQVIAWAPQQNTVAMLGDPSPGLAGTFTDREHGALYADPFTFFRAWVEARAAWAVEYLDAKGKTWRAPPRERDLVPGCLMIGALDQIAWQPSALPAELTCIGVETRAVNRAILKAARLPFAVNGTKQNPLRRAA